MSKIILWMILITYVLNPAVFAQVPEVEVVAEDSTNNQENHEKSTSAKKKGKPFEEVIEDYEVIEGLFNLYRSEEEGKVYLEIKPGQFETGYLCNITRESGDGYWFDGGAILEEFVFFFKRVGKNVQFVQKNLKFRADRQAPIHRAVERDIPHSIRSNANIVSEPHPERGSVLVDAGELFIYDVGEVGYLTGQTKMSYSLDKKNSYFYQLKSFPLNTEIEVALHFKSSKPQPVFTLADSRSMIHRYHYSLSTVPESDYQPRAADDRIGHFYAMHQDYNSILRNDPYERYIARWHLQKGEPKFKLSKPKQPIIFWIENTTPVEYRDAIRQGALLWNQAFERLGFQDAIEIRQMPDDAEWDPADVRYNTIRWIVQPGGIYAAGPFRANPYTGQIYDADIRISADLLRLFYDQFDQLVTPAAWRSAGINDFFPGIEPENPPVPQRQIYQCNLARGLAHQMSFGWRLIEARDRTDNLPAVTLKKFIHDALVYVVAHEVGHTLGLRHNYKASAVYAQENLSDKTFTQKNGLAGSLMDYLPVNLSPRGEKQGAYFQNIPGPYDYWSLEYAYRPYDPDSKTSENEMLDKIARRVAEPELRFGTDEDAFEFSVRSIDPTCNLWDMGQDALQYYARRLELSRELWKNLVKDVEKREERYPQLTQAFNLGIREYALASMTVSKYIGGIYHHRDHIGDPGNRPPLEPVPAGMQRRTLQFLIENFFSPNSFQFSPELLNKLAPERLWDFEGTVFHMQRLDYPIHGIIQLLQAMTLFRLYSPLLLARIEDNEIRFPGGGERFSMAELFTALREAVWQELAGGENISSFRRELQRIYLYVLDEILVRFPPGYPRDAATLARDDFLQIKSRIEEVLKSGQLDVYTRAHLQESAAKIKISLEAQMQRQF